MSDLELKINNFFIKYELIEEEKKYLTGQIKRLAYTTNLINSYSRNFSDCTLLDVGPHFLTRCLIEFLDPKPKISTLGFPYKKLVPDNLIEKNVTLDFNLIDGLGNQFNENQFNIISVCEVIEHLFIPPNVFFSFLKSMLKPEGYLFVGTPNAVSIGNRAKMMMGINPFNKLSNNWRNGISHIREYTLDELVAYGDEAGLSLAFSEYCDYWPQIMSIPNISELEKQNPSFKTGLTVIFQLK